MDPGAPERRAGIAATMADATTGAAVWAWQVGRPVRALAGAAVGTAANAVLRLTPPDVLAALTDRGRSGRAELERRGAAMLRLVAPHVIAAVLETTDLTALVRRHIDLDTVAAGLDVDAVVYRVDLDAVAGRIDLDALAARIDPDPVVARVDLDAVVHRIDLDAAVARVDLDAAVRRLDIDAAVRRIDLDAVLARVDVVGIAREVIDAIDLPEIVRHSTGTLTSDTVRTVRREAMQADEVVAGFLDRLLRRQVQRASAPS